MIAARAVARRGRSSWRQLHFTKWQTRGEHVVQIPPNSICERPWGVMAYLVSWSLLTQRNLLSVQRSSS